MKKLKLIPKIQMEQDLIKFIEEKDITFEEGKRNTDSVLLSGYALYLGYSFDELFKYCKKTFDTSKITGWSNELERVFAYAKKNNYGKYYKL